MDASVPGSRPNGSDQSPIWEKRYLSGIDRKAEASQPNSGAIGVRLCWCGGVARRGERYFLGVRARVCRYSIPA